MSVGSPRSGRRPATSPIRTEFRDRELLSTALNAARCEHSGVRKIVVVEKPTQMRIDLSTGLVSTNDDPTAQALVGRLRQLYAEAKYTRVLTEHGGRVESRGETEDGNIVLVCTLP